jgi:hypothetical protein
MLTRSTTFFFTVRITIEKIEKKNIDDGVSNFCTHRQAVLHIIEHTTSASLYIQFEER